MVKVVPVGTNDGPHVPRLGFMAGEIQVPDEFDRMCEAEIGRLFEGDS